MSYPNVTGSSSAAATPTLLADYTNLQEQWASVTTSSHTIRVTTAPACPTSSTSVWTLDPSASLPTISGLDFATVKEASLTRLSTSSTSTSTSTRSSDSSTGNSSGSSNGDSNGSDSKTRIGVGVGVGVGVGLLLMATALFFWWRRKRANTTSSDSKQLEKKQSHFRELVGEGTVPQPHEISGDPSAAADPKEILSSEILEVSTTKNNTQGDLGASELDTTNAAGDRESVPSPVQNRTSTIVSPPVFATETTSSTSANFSRDELAEEADIAVQELGLINLRKRALAAQAEAFDSTPESMAGRKGEEYRELLQREARIATRLEEIENQPRSTN